MRLVVWKFEENDEWEIYGHEFVGMGDPPASICMETTKGVASEKGQHIDKQAADQLKKQSYVDDGANGGSKADVERMRGNIIKLEGGKLQFDGTIAQILATVGFKPKTIICSGDDDPDITSKMSKVLGLEWVPKEDIIRYKLNFNLHKRNGASKAGPDLTPQDIPSITILIFTRRIALTLTAQIYDPLGIICSFTIKFKLQLRIIVQHDLGWDEPLPDALQDVWRQLVIMSLTSTPLEFPRSLMKPGVVGRPELCCFWDGSDVAFAGCVYTRWMMEDGSWHTTLVTAKTRVTPQAGCTTPRSELSGLVVLARLTNKVVEALDVPPARITFMGDSTCTISACQVNCSSLKPFFSNRVMEVLSLMSSWGPKSNVPANEELSRDQLEDMEAEVMVDEIQHIPGNINIADKPTRGNVEWDELGAGSDWQEGPKFLKENRNSWPISRDFIQQIPEGESKSRFFKVVQVFHQVAAMSWRPGPGDHQAPMPFAVKVLRVMWRFNDLARVRGTMARLCNAQRNGSSSFITETPSARDYKEGDWWLHWLSMPDTVKAINKAKGKNESTLCPFWVENLLVARGRLTPRAMKVQLGHEYLILLSHKSRLS